MTDAEIERLTVENKRLRAIVVGGPKVCPCVNELRHLRDELARKDEALRALDDWASRMPDAGFVDTSPRWDWWHERPREEAAKNVVGSGIGSGMSDTCVRCGADSSDNWFDRSFCPCKGGGVMHQRCTQCGYAYGECAFEEDEERGCERS